MAKKHQTRNSKKFSDRLHRANARLGRRGNNAEPLPPIVSKPEGLLVSGRPIVEEIGESLAFQGAGPRHGLLDTTAARDRRMRNYKEGVTIAPRAKDYVGYASDTDQLGEFLPYGLAHRSEVPHIFGRDEKVKQATADLRQAERRYKAVAELADWIRRGSAVLERPGHSIFHNFLEEQASLVIVNDELLLQPGWALDLEQSKFDDYQVFLVEHDWAAAFKNATDFAEGEEFKAPYDRCAFEFKFSGMRWLVMLQHNRTISIIARTSVGWIAPMFNYVFRDGKWQWLGMEFKPNQLTHIPMPEGHEDPWRFLFDVFLVQLKAVCVALEAKVADTDQQAPPASVNRQRAKHDKQPLAGYHVVRLSHQCHRARSEPVEGREVVRHRMHFRRGHWRHYHAEADAHGHQWLAKDALGRECCAACSAYRRWIEWQLVGDPDLGFIDKEYRL